MLTSKVDPLKIQGWMTGPELSWLSRNAAEYKSIVEVGAWKGRSTAALLNTCPGTVWAVDHFQGSAGERDGAHFEVTYKDIHAEFMENVGSFDNLKVLKMDSLEAAKTFGFKSIEMVFIDACHEYEAVMADIKAWLPRTSKLICGHDSWDVREALNDSGLDWHHGTGLIWFATIANEFARVERAG